MLAIISCKKSDKLIQVQLPKVEVEVIEKTFDFGKATHSDTIRHTFLIKNLSQDLYKIDTVGVSCGCTSTGYTKNSIKINEFAKVNVEYVPKPNDNGSVSKAIVVSDNSKSSFHTLYLEGIITK